MPRPPSLVVLAILLAAPLGAQPAAPLRWAADSLPVIGSDIEDRARLLQLRGADSTAGWLVRSLSSRLAIPFAGDTLSWGWIAPELHVVSNSDLPFSQNDGALWAGRGISARVRGGIAGSIGRVRFVLAPELATSNNKDFVEVDIVGRGWNRPAYDPNRLSEFASPWNQHPVSADVPVRYGRSPYDPVGLGQSSVWYDAGAIAAGLSTENLWWGPGIHDALIMTNNAAGVPHAFLRTARPLRTPVGDVEGRLIVGALAESNYFDFDPSNDTRSLSAFVATLRPRWAPDLTVGVARAVFAPTSSGLSAFGHVLDAFGTFDRPASRPETDSAFTNGRDQLTSLFARYVFPSVGWEVYGEVGRAERPASLRDLLVDPGHTRAYVLGAQHARPVAAGALLRLQVEATQMEQSTSYRYRPTASWYTSRAMPQGYTQQGQVIGATAGPGSSHQWLAADWMAPTWSAGVFFGRWRFNTDAMYASTDFPLGTGWCEFDTTLYPGARGSYRDARWGFVQLEAIFGTRYNAFHQNNSGCPAPDAGRNLKDVRNRTLRLTIAPRIFR